MKGREFLQMLLKGESQSDRSNESDISKMDYGLKWEGVLCCVHGLYIYQAHRCSEYGFGALSDPRDVLQLLSDR